MADPGFREKRVKQGKQRRVKYRVLGKPARGSWAIIRQYNPIFFHTHKMGTSHVHNSDSIKRGMAYPIP